jgi:hypothetical protein
VCGFLVHIFVSWLLKSPVLKVVNFQSTGQSKATASSPTESSNKQGSVSVIFVVQMDKNAEHARLLMTNKECGWHMQMQIETHLQLSTVHSLPSPVYIQFSAFHCHVHSTNIQSHTNVKNFRGDVVHVLSQWTELSCCPLLYCTIFHAHTSHFF